MNQLTGKLFVDFFSPDEGHIYSIKKEIVSKKTKYQQMEILETGSFGTCLILDGRMQSSQVDEFIYHESLVHPAMLAHPDPKKVFIVGGGEGATLREVLRHKEVEDVLMIDIDEEVVECCKEYMLDWHQGAFDDSRVRLQFKDARQFLESTEEKFDVIIIDISEPVKEGPAYLLYTQDFYRTVYNKLTQNGVISLQAGTTNVTSLEVLSTVCNTLKTAFPVVMPYSAAIPSFGVNWGFIMASKKEIPLFFDEDFFNNRSNGISGKMRHYDFDIHRGQFLLPLYIKEAIASQKRTIEDNHPLYLLNH